MAANSYQCGVDEAVCGRPGLRRDQAVQGELLLGAVNRRDVVGRIALLGVRVHLHWPVTVLWHESVDSDCLRLYPRLVETARRRYIKHNVDIVYISCILWQNRCNLGV